MFLAVCDVLVKVWTLEMVLLEELREDTRVRVDHVDVGVAVGDRVVVVLYISPNKFIYFLKHPEDPDFRVFR